MVKIENIAPQYYFVQKDWELKKHYDKGFSLQNLFPVNSVGIVTSRDKFVVDDSKQKLENRIIDFFDSDKDSLLSKYPLKENKSWKIDKVKLAAKEYKKNDIQRLSYRPFDSQYVYYDPHFIERSRNETMKHMLNGKNVGLVYKLGNSEESSASCHFTKTIIDFRSWSRPGMQGGDYISPLYLYPDDDSLDSSRVPNLDMSIVKDIQKSLGLEFVAERSHHSSSLSGVEVLNGDLGTQSCNTGTSTLLSDLTKTFTPIDILDYIYAVLHSPSYREKYKEFLKIDFPRVPYPTIDTFWQLVELGSQLRQIHLLESLVVTDFITSYPVDGDNIVDKPNYKDDKVYINKEQYFDSVPEVAWNFYIGGYQPAQKWLKDRKGRELGFEDILHYQKIIVALTETDKLMREIDKVYSVA